MADNKWIKDPNLDASGRYKFTYTADKANSAYNYMILETENTFVDKNIFIQANVGSGTLSAGSGNVTLSNHGATGLLGTVSSSQPDGHFLEITGSGYVKVSTAGWLAATPNNEDGILSSSATKYYPIQSAAFNWGTGANANKLYCTTSGYVAASDSVVIDSINTTSVVQTNVTTISGTTATGATATWGTGYITSGSIAAATFSNEPASGKTLASYVDISNTTAAPVLSAGDYLYINRGYVDNIVISLDKLVPNNATIAVINEQSAHILSGYSAYDNRGHLIAGTIPTITLPSATDESATQNYTSQATIYATTADQYLNIPSGFNAANVYYKLNKLTQSNFSAANIKHNITISVSNGDSTVYSQKGTFTTASTAQSANGAADANKILKNYGAWVDGNEITGTIESRSWPTSTASSATSGYSGTTFNTSTSNRYINLTSGYYAANKYYLIRAVTTSGNITAGNIKHGVVMKVGDSADDDRIVAAVTGTFTSASTVSSGQTAATYDSTTHESDVMLSSYSAWVNGIEIKGTIATKTNSNLSFDGATRTFTAPAGYYASDATKQIAAASLTAGNGAVSLTSDTGTLSIYSTTNTRGITISDNAPAANSGKVYIKVTGSGSVNNSIGWLNTATSTSSNNKTRHVILTLYDGTFTTG